MKRISILTLCLLPVFSAFADLGLDIGAEDQLNYIERYKKIAIEEMKRTGVPASIKLAQGLLESAAGKSQLATKGNNHFGIKCGSVWKGKTIEFKDDDRDKNGKLIKSCFRVYKNPEESFRAHSDFLRDPRKDYRYGPLFDLKPTDYKAWAKGLKKAGYATNPKYPQHLIALIERYDLHQYDKMDLMDVEKDRTIEDKPKQIEEEEFFAGLTMRNNVRMIYADGKESITNISTKFNLSTEKVKDFNETKYQQDEILDKGTIVYLQRKRSYFRGTRKWHYVKEGEDMFYISQLYGVQLNKLYSKNLMPEGSQPQVGEKIRLRGKLSKKEDSPKLIGSGVPVSDTEKEEKEFIWEPEQEVEVSEENEQKELEELADINLPKEEDPATDNKQNELPEIGDTPSEPEQNNGSNNGNIELPDPDAEEPANTDPSPEPEKEKESEIKVNNYHVVKKGDTLYSIARKYNLSVTKLKSMNGLKSNIISIDQKLKVN